jgi:hypothetical protein
LNYLDSFVDEAKYSKLVSCCQFFSQNMLANCSVIIYIQSLYKPAIPGCRGHCYDDPDGEAQWQKQTREWAQRPLPLRSHMVDGSALTFFKTCTKLRATFLT